jgi:hypothetical protein
MYFKTLNGLKHLTKTHKGGNGNRRMAVHTWTKTSDKFFVRTISEVSEFDRKPVTERINKTLSLRGISILTWTSK